jgi:hypothetical protein
MKYLLGSAVSGGLAVSMMYLNVDLWFTALCFAAVSGWCAAYLTDWSIEEED